MGAAIGRLDQQIVAILVLVRQAALEDAAGDRPRVLGGGLIDREIGRGRHDAALGIGALQGADDVAALAHPAQRILDALGEAPTSLGQAFRQPQPGQRCQAAHLQALLERLARRCGHDAVGIHRADQPAVDAGQPFLVDLGAQPRLDVAVATRPKIQVDEFGGALADAAGQIVGRDNEIAAAFVLSPHDDMGVRMAGIEVIDRHPVEPGTEILLEPRHQPPGQALEVGILVAVLGRDDEAELMAVGGLSIEPVLAVHGIRVAAVEFARPSVAGHAVALDVAQVRAGAGEALAGELREPRFDDDAALAKSGVAVTPGEQPSDASPAADPGGGIGAASARAAAREIRGGEHARKIGSPALAAAAADAAEPRFEVVFRRHRSIPSGAPRQSCLARRRMKTGAAGTGGFPRFPAPMAPSARRQCRSASRKMMCRQTLTAPGVPVLYLALRRPPPEPFLPPVLAFPTPADVARAEAKRSRDADACPAPLSRRFDSADQCVTAKAWRAARSLRKWRRPVNPCAFPSPSTMLTATNQRPFKWPMIATRSSSKSSSSAPS